MKESLRFNDELCIENGVIKTNHTSARLVGELTINEVNPLGEVVFSSTEYNDITIGGATFILEQMFKKASSRSRFNLTGIKDWNGPTSSDDADKYISDEKIFGFMIGIGGEDGISVKAPSFTTRQLDEFVPFRIHDIGGILDVSGDDENLYLMSLNSRINNKTYTGYYVKKFSDNTNTDQNSAVDIIPEYTDGSGIVSNSNISTTDSPIYTYAKVVMEINSDDVRDYFEAKDGVISNCRINQLGLVAGKYIETDAYGVDIYDDVKLVTIVNFKGRDLSNRENTLKLRYKIYCM